MLTDAELDELERLAHRWKQFPTWTDSVRMGSAMAPALRELRSARATIAEMRGRLERALGSVDAALGDERLLALTTSGVASEGVQNESAVIPVTSENDGLGPNHVDARKET